MMNAYNYLYVNDVRQICWCYRGEQQSIWQFPVGATSGYKWQMLNVNLFNSKHLLALSRGKMEI